MLLEKIYGQSFKKILKIINPVKKIIITTECEVHLFNNHHAIMLLKKYNYDEAYAFFKSHIKDINKGSVWADQDFKSINHFYNPYKKKGLFGHGHSLELAENYYNIALGLYLKNDIKAAMFYFGACIHIIQDLTIPQHVNIRLLDNHRQYENFVKYTFDIVKEYISEDPPILLDNPKAYIEYNARIAIRIGNKYYKENSRKLRFHKITLTSLPLAQSTSAGAMILFLNDISKLLYI